jgi:3'-phosphoadenosine 5'-phosphosulfate sulfotransferase (PAPS reductase)/FAD synthetase
MAKSHYQLPGGEDDLMVIPCSGGADSTWLAILMHELFPEVDFYLIFTDTLADDPSIYETLNQLENYLGKKIERVIPELGLMDLIKKWDGFLPSSNSRYCTRYLKLKPFEKSMQRLRNKSASGIVHTFVGLRADEPGRSGLISHMDWIQTHLPFREMGVVREDVFTGLANTIGVPKLYFGRSRSGCVCCPFQRKSELIYSMKNHPVEFREGEKLEKLTKHDEQRFAKLANSLSRETGMAANHLTLPFPARVDARTEKSAKPIKWTPQKRRNAGTLALFPVADLYVGAEIYTNPGCGSHGVWKQNIVSYSSTRAGIARQLTMHYWMRRQAPEVMGLTVDELEGELNLVIYRIQIPAHLAEVTQPDEASYTWQSAHAYSQVRQVMTWIERCLHAAGMKETVKDYEGARPGSWRYEAHGAQQMALKAITEPVGEVLEMDLFEPPIEPPEEEDKEVVCFQCSL